LLYLRNGARCPELSLAASSRWLVLCSGMRALRLLSLWTVGTAPEWQIVVADCGRPLCPVVGDGGRTASTCCGPWKSAEPSCSQFSAERAASAACSATAWRGIVLAPGGRSEQRCFAHAATFGWCRLEHRGAQRCSSRSWTGSDCTPVSVQGPSSTGVSNVTDGLCVEVAWSCHCRDVLTERQTQARLLAPSSPRRLADQPLPRTQMTRTTSSRAADYSFRQSALLICPGLAADRSLPCPPDISGGGNKIIPRLPDESSDAR